MICPTSGAEGWIFKNNSFTLDCVLNSTSDKISCTPDRSWDKVLYHGKGPVFSLKDWLPVFSYLKIQYEILKDNPFIHTNVKKNTIP